jgi:hypothetical protein
MIMNKGDRVKLLRAVGIYPAGCKGVVDHVGGDGYLDVSLNENEQGKAINPVVPLPPSPKDAFELC